MEEYPYKQQDFENPSFLFRLEDSLKGVLGSFLYDPFIKLFGLKGDENALDFGCGGGSGSKYILKKLGKNGTLTCLDISSFWMKRAERRLAKYDNVSFIHGDIRKVDIPEGSFDVIAVVHVIHDIEPKERESVVLALAGKLVASGKLFIFEPTKCSHGMPVSEIRNLMEKAEINLTSFLVIFYSQGRSGSGFLLH